MAVIDRKRKKNEKSIIKDSQKKKSKNCKFQKNFIEKNNKFYFFELKDRNQISFTNVKKSLFIIYDVLLDHGILIRYKNYFL